MVDETKIPRNRLKIAMAAVGCAVFVGLGIWLVSLDDSRIISERGFRLFFNSPLYTHSLGGLAIAFFGLVAVFLIRKFFDNTPGLIFNAEGLTDNAGMNAAGFIPWEEIETYEVFEMSGQKTLVIVVTDPDKYASRGSFLKRKLNAANAQMVGSPVSISPITLGVGFEELVDIFEKYHHKYGARENPRL